MGNLASLVHLRLNFNPDLCAPADPQFRAWLIERGAYPYPCRSNPDARVLPLVLMRVDGNGMSLRLGDGDLFHPEAVNVSDPGVVAATIAGDVGEYLELVPLGIGRADVEVVPYGGGSPAIAGVSVREAVGTFGIDIVMEEPAPLGFEETMVEAADWWSSVLDGTEWEDRRPCGVHYATALADELLIAARATDITDRVAARVRTCFLEREDGSLRPGGGRIEANLRSSTSVGQMDVMRHEIGYVLGLVGLTGLVTTDFATDRDWGHFTGPRAVEAYRAGGGSSDLPGVPLWAGDGHHWGVHGELMSSTLMVDGSSGESLNDADGLSIAALADLGYTVDMTKATPWRQWGAAAAAMAGKPFREVVEVRIVPDPVLEPRR